MWGEKKYLYRDISIRRLAWIEEGAVNATLRNAVYRHSLRWEKKPFSSRDRVPTE